MTRPPKPPQNEQAAFRSTLNAALGRLGGGQKAWMTGAGPPPDPPTGSTPTSGTPQKARARRASAATASQLSPRQERVDSPSLPANVPPAAPLASSPTARLELGTIDLTLAPSPAPAPAPTPPPQLPSPPSESAFVHTPAAAPRPMPPAPASFEEQLFQGANQHIGELNHAASALTQYGTSAWQPQPATVHTVNTALHNNQAPAPVNAVNIAFFDHQPPATAMSNPQSFAVAPLPFQTCPAPQAQPDTHSAPYQHFGINPHQANAAFPTTPGPAPAAPALPAPPAAPCPRDSELCLRALEKAQKKGWITTLDERSRWTVMKDAVKRGDFEYVAIHQRFCWLSTTPDRHIPPYFHGPSVGQAEEALGQILGSNRNLSKNILRFFANFPVPMPTQEQQWNDIFVHDNCVYLEFARSCGRLQTDLHAWLCRRCPPLSRELSVHYHINSHVLQEIVFRWAWRKMLNNEPGNEETGLALLREARDVPFEQGVAGRPGAANDAAAISWELKSFAPLVQEQLRLGELALSQPSTTQINNAIVVNPNQMSPQSPVHALVPGPGIPSPVFAPVALQQPLQNRAPAPVTQLGPPRGRRRVPRVQPAAALPQRSFPPQRQQPGVFQVAHPVQPPMQPRTPIGDRAAAMVAAAGFPVGSGLPSQDTRPHIPLLPELAHLQSIYPPAPPNQRFFPLPGFKLPHQREANPGRFALHEADKRSPILRPRNLKSSIRWQYVKGFAKDPARLPETSGSVTWTIFLSAEELTHRPEDVEQPDGAPPERRYDLQSRTWRLRSIMSRRPKSPNDPDRLPNEHDWHTTASLWHPYVYFSLNDKPLSHRTKLHWGKDFPLDLTPHLKKGENKLEITVVRERNDLRYRDWLYAVETIAFEDDNTVISRCMQNTLSRDSVLNGIREKLTHYDDVAIIADGLATTADSLTINVRDPISQYRIPDVPVRSTQCAHNDCFDLKTFLASRRTNPATGVTYPDTWRCPTCFADARPPLLVIDRFMESVLEELKHRGLSEETRAITVAADGTWKPKEEVRSRNGVRDESADTESDGKAGRKRKISSAAVKSKTTTPKMEPRTPVEVIDLSD